MNDYVTRKEFEEAIAALRCYGDMQTINVTQTPGGQTISSMQVIQEEAAADPTYLTVAYDSDLQEFTVDLDNFPIYPVQGYSGTNYLITTQKLSETLVFDKPGSNQTVDFYVSYSRSGTSGYRLHWLGSVTASDSATEALYTAVNFGTKIASVTLKSDGTYTIATKPTIDTTAIVQRIHFDTYLWVNTSIKTIRLEKVWNPFVNDTVNLSYSYSEPFNDGVILGFTNGSTSLTLDAYANRGSYSEYFKVGSVIISSSNNIQRLDFNNYFLGAVYTMSLGYTGTQNVGSKTLNIRHGRIINVT